jgi:hypothetical protein
MSRTVFIAEVEDTEYTGEDNDHFLTGRFYGHVDAGHRITDSFEDLSLDEALAADGGGWSTMHSRQYEIDITVRAPTASRAREAALVRVPPLPDGWRVVAWVRFEGG